MKQLFVSRGLLTQRTPSGKAKQREVEDLKQMRLVSELSTPKVSSFTARCCMLQAPNTERKLKSVNQALTFDSLTRRTVTPSREIDFNQRQLVELTPTKALNSGRSMKRFSSIYSMDGLSSCNRFIPRSKPRLKRLTRLKMSPSLSTPLLMRGKNAFSKEL